MYTEVQEFYLRSQAVQRNLPRPSDINTSILRGTLHPEQKMRSLYEVCIHSIYSAHFWYVMVDILLGDPKYEAIYILYCSFIN